MASRAIFRPHGLIKSQMQHQLYERAHIANLYTGLANPKEHETVALMEVVLYKNVFNDDNFAITSEQPPSMISERRCDLVIKYLESGSFDIKALCFAECKRTNTDREFNLARLEQQAKGYCKLYLDAEPNPGFVYAATMAGAHIRMWSYDRDGSWIPFWGSHHEGDWAEYKDIGDDAAGSELEGWFSQMKSVPPSAHAGQELSDYVASNQPTSVLDSSAFSLGYSAPYNTMVGTSGGSAIQQQGGYPGNPINSINVSGDPSGEAQTYAMSSSNAQLQSTGQPQTSGQGGMYSAEPHGVHESGRGGDLLVVQVERIRHMTRPDEYTFVDQRGRKRSTSKSEWTKTRHDGQTAWLYRGRKWSYVTYTNMA